MFPKHLKALVSNCDIKLGGEWDMGYHLLVLCCFECFHTFEVTYHKNFSKYSPTLAAQKETLVGWSTVPGE